MKSDDFEQKLQRQPLREIPAAWREDILRTAAQVSPSAVSRVSKAADRDTTSGDIASTLREFLAEVVRELVWRPRRVWTGFAVIWLIIISINLADSGPSAGSGRNTYTMVMAWQRQQRLMAELMASTDARDADRPKPPRTGPRSEGQHLQPLG